MPETPHSSHEMGTAAIKRHRTHLMAYQVIQENTEEIPVPELQQQEDIQYLENLLQVSFNPLNDEENFLIP